MDNTLGYELSNGGSIPSAGTKYSYRSLLGCRLEAQGTGLWNQYHEFESHLPCQ